MKKKVYVPDEFYEKGNYLNHPQSYYYTLKSLKHHCPVAYEKDMAYIQGTKKEHDVCVEHIYLRVYIFSHHFRNWVRAKKYVSYYESKK